MAKRTVIQADEELVIKGKLTVEGNVTQLETTQVVTNLAGNVFTINSDGSNTSAVIALNSNGTTATLSFDDANGSVVFDKPINVGSIQLDSNVITAPEFVGDITGNVTGTVSSIANHSTTDLAEGTNLYYTVIRANSAIDARLPSTDALAEGLTNQYYTDARSNSAVEAYLSGDDGVDYANGVITVDNTVIRTTGDQSLTGNTTLVGNVFLTGDLIPTTSNTYNIGSTDLHINEMFVNVLHLEQLDLGDANISDIHSSFIAGVRDTPYITTNTANGLLYTHNTVGAAYAVSTGAGLTIDGNNNLSIDNTVITTAGGQTINGDLILTGNLSVVNIDSVTQSDSFVSDKVLYLNVGGGATPNNSRMSVEKTAANVYIEYNDRWKFSNDGANVSNILLFADFSAGNGLSYNNAGEYSAVAGDGISVGSNISVDATVVRTTGDQSIAGIKNFTGELVLPLANSATSNNAIFVSPSSNSCFVVINGFPVQLTADSDVGQVEDVGATGINIYAGFRTQPVDNVEIVYHGIKSIDTGSLLTISESANVITVAGNSNAVTSLFSVLDNGGDGNLSYNNNTGVFTYTGPSAAEVRAHISGSGLISYNSTTGEISTTADNYASWAVQTDSGSGSKYSVASTETLTIQGGTNISVTNTGNVITIVNDNAADITDVNAGAGLTGGGVAGNVSLAVGAGNGIIVNADDIEVNVAYVRNQFSVAGDLNYNASTGVFSFTNDLGDIESVTAGAGLTGGGTSGNVTLDIGAGTGITVSTDNIAVNMSVFSTTDLIEGANLYFTTARANSAMDAYLLGGAGLTYTSGTFTVSAGPGITVNADNVALTSDVITTGPGTYGSANQVPAVTVDTYGRVTAISNISISVTSSQVSDFATAANTAIDARVSGGNGLTYASGVLAVGAGNYIIVSADTVAVDATTTATANKVAARDASGDLYANVFHGTATSARYADLAENYLADAEYEPGTVLVFGGEAEVSQSTAFESTKVAGVVTTQPAHVMNSHLEGEHIACVALRGRVPVKVLGVVHKGDVLVSAGKGHAAVAMDPKTVPAAAIVGKAISGKSDSGPGVVEVLV